MTKNDKQTYTVVGVLVVALLAGIGWFAYSKNGTAVKARKDTVELNQEVRKSVQDGAADVGQAASDAVTPGDQDTTRPNKDGSTDKLDQK